MSRNSIKYGAINLNYMNFPTSELCIRDTIALSHSKLSV